MIIALLAPSEADLVEKLGDEALVSSACEERGADIIMPTPYGLYGIQRKEFPHDFLSSCFDGRLARETSLMQESFRFSEVLVEKRPRYYDDGHVVHQAPKGHQFDRFTRDMIQKTIMEIRFVKGVEVTFTEDNDDTVRYIKTAAEFIQNTKHISLSKRPPGQGLWGAPSGRFLHSWILQGFPGVGPGLSDSILSHFGTIPLTWTCSREEMMNVPKIGESRASKLFESLT